MAVSFSRPQTRLSGLNLTPLIDVVFQLLVFFMLTSSFISPSIKMSLPKAMTEGSLDQKQENIIVSLSEDGMLYLNNNQSSIDLLPSELKQALSRTQAKEVYLKADKKVHYDSFFKLIEIATNAGADNFHLVHESE